MKNLLSIVAILSLILLTSIPAHSQVKLKKGEITKVSGGLCGLIKSKWTPVKKSGSKYVADKSAKSSVKKSCKALLSPNTFKTAGLTKIPSASKMLATRSGISSKGIKVGAVSGTPPILSEIPSNIKNTFWREGVIDGLISGSPTQNQCSEFFSGSEGESGGIPACYQVQGLGYAFQNVLSSANSVCYMKNFPTQSNLEAGGLTLLRGTLPDNDISKIFSVPEGSESRKVEVQISGFQGGGDGGGRAQSGPERIIIEVDSLSKNRSNGNQYSYTILFCGSGETPNGIEKTTVGLNGQFTAKSAESNSEGSHQSELKAFIASLDGELTFDATKARRAIVTSTSNNGKFKSDVTISSDEIKTYVYDKFGSGTRKNYGVAKFSGSGLSSFRVLAGAQKSLEKFGSDSEERSFSGATEFRDTFYASAPTSELVEELDAVNIATDEFYAEEPSVTIDTEGKSCADDAEIVVSLDFSNSTLQQSVATCEGDRLDNMDFCRTTDIQNAENQYFTGCR